MPRGKSVNREESTVSTEVENIEATEQSEDIESIMAALRAEIKEKQAKVKELKGEKAPRTPRVKGEKAAKPSKTLEEVVAAQMASPRASAVQRLVRAAHARVDVGQSVNEAVEGVMEQYAAIVFEILSSMAETGKSGREATIAHFEANFPTVSSGRKRAKNADEAESEDDLEDDED